MSIVPSIGRKLWYWPVGEPTVVVMDPRQALDATVLFVWSDTMVNLLVVDHAGNFHDRPSAMLHQGSVDDRPSSSCATWMTYQREQAAKAVQG